MWDVTGGTRENNEFPVVCAFREAKEELNLDLKEDSIIWCREYEHLGESSPGGYFMVACITDEQLSKIRLGNEGQFFKLHDINDFIKLENIVPFVRERITDYMHSNGLLRLYSIKPMTMPQKKQEVTCCTLKIFIIFIIFIVFCWFFCACP